MKINAINAGFQTFHNEHRKQTTSPPIKSNSSEHLNSFCQFLTVFSDALWSFLVDLEAIFLNNVYLTNQNE